MLVIENVSKLFSYNWSSIIKNLVPKGNKGQMSPQSIKDITTGSITRILGVVLAQAAVIGIAVYVAIRVYSAFGGLSGYFGNALQEAIAESAGTWIGQLISAAIIPIIALIFVQVMKTKQQNAWPYFILLIIAISQAVYSVYGIFGWFALIIASPIFAIIGLVSVAAAVLGSISIAVGCIDFCLQLAPETATVPKPGQPPVANQPTTPIAPVSAEQPVQQPPVFQPVQQPPVSQPVSPSLTIPESSEKIDDINQ